MSWRYQYTILVVSVWWSAHPYTLLPYLERQWTYLVCSLYAYSIHSTVFMSKISNANNKIKCIVYTCYIYVCKHVCLWVHCVCVYTKSWAFIRSSGDRKLVLKYDSPTLLINTSVNNNQMDTKLNAVKIFLQVKSELLCQMTCKADRLA